MEKKELVYLYLAANFRKGRTKFTQKQIASKLKISLSTVNNALKPLVKMHAVEVYPRGFTLKDFEKLMFYWASVRDIEKDIIYSTFYSESPSKIESSMPSDVLFTAYSGYKIVTRNAPADYSEIYVYSEKIDEIKKRFPKRKGPKNIFVLRSHPLLKKFSNKNCVDMSLIFVDLWNLYEWYAKEFIKGAKKLLFE